jgi:hypothetical protein
MPHLVFDNEPYEQYGEENSHQRIGKVKEVDAFDMQLRSHKQVGIVNRIFKDNGSQSAYNADEKTQYIQKLPVTEFVNLPLEDLVTQKMGFQFHP